MKISSSSQRGDFSHLIHSPFKRMDGSTSPEKLLWKTEEYIKQHNDFDFAEKLKSVEKLLAGTHDQNRQVHFQQQLKQEADTVFVKVEKSWLFCLRTVAQNGMVVLISTFKNWPNRAKN